MKPDRRRDPRMTIPGLCFLIGTAIVFGVIVGTLATDVVTNTPWDTRGGPGIQADTHPR